MNKQEIEQRIIEISKSIEQSAANHNAWIGRLEEAKYMLQSIVEAELKCISTDVVE